jgi:hypothetical protein
MNKNTFIQYLLNSASAPIVEDPYWNDVVLCLRLDGSTNSRGLPVYRDYSKYQYQVRSFTGTDSDSAPTVISNGNTDYPILPSTGDINVDTFLTLPNKRNHTLRLAEINSSQWTSIVNPSYFEVLYGGNPDFSLGTDEFTIDLTFYTDETALPWRWQTLFCIGSALSKGSISDLASVATSINYNGYLGGFGLFLVAGQLVHTAAGNLITLTSAPLVKNTWYTISLERRGNTLYYYQNGQLINTFSYNFTLSNGYNSASTLRDTLVIGAHVHHTQFPFSGFTPYDTTENIIDTSFSGGISNFRITKAARYLQSFYTVNLPLPLVTPIGNKIDSYYEDVLFNIPALYDVYDYSSYSAHFTNKELLRTVPNTSTGFIELDGVNEYITKTIGAELGDAWTIEFYISTFINGIPSRDYLAENRRSLRSFLTDVYGIQYINTDEVYEQVPLIELDSNNKKILKVNLNVLTKNTPGVYYSLLTSSNGTDWLTYPSEANINWNEGLSGGFGGTPSKILPDNEIKFFMQRGASISGLTDYDSIKYNAGYDEPNTHIAICRYNDNIYVLVNGVVQKTIPFAYDLYQYTNNLSLKIGGTYNKIAGRKSGDTINSLISFGIKGVRVTNEVRYNLVSSNNYFYENSLQPLPLAANKLAPPRARILAILKKDISSSISSDEAEWYVYVTQPIDNLVLADFSLTQLDGISGASLTSLTKINNYVYSLKASTGTGNGTLQANFVDRKTVRYADTNTYISYAIGELSFEGEAYRVNKNAPVPLLSSGSSPYIADIFTVTLRFDAAIANFDPSKIGIVNGKLSQLRFIDEDNHIYELDIEPIKQDPVIVQVMEGCASTSTGIFSTKSAPLVRIYSDSFPILQTPLSISTTLNDLSPSKLLLFEVISNNTSFSNAIAPLGETSSLAVSPLLEQSGLTYDNFNAVASTYTTAINQDWTIEFFLRINSTQNTTTKKSHILSVENAQTGFALFADNGQLKFQRSATNISNLFPSITWNDRDTTDFIAWDNDSYSQLRKYPHFAITKKDNVYRFYRNGIRVGIVQSNTAIDITKGDLFIGYYPNRVDDVDFFISNIRFTLGKALYTAYSVNVPGLPFEEVPNITDETQLLSYISIYSNNNISSVATAGNKITLKFTSIIPLVGLPTVLIAGHTADVVAKPYNEYIATLDITDSFSDGQCNFSIAISDQPGIPDKTFTATTNNSAVFIDNTSVTATLSTSQPDDNSYTFPVLLTFSEPIQLFTLDKLTLTNCKVSNLLKYPNESKYSFYVTALSTGDVTVELPTHTIQDLAGTYNTAGTSLTRAAEVPDYIPDTNYSNVLVLLQPEDVNIVDESIHNLDITATNVSVVNDTSPIGLAKSIYFNGKDSSLSFNLSDTLQSNSEYTIEFYMNSKSSTVFRLARPTALPASSVTSNSFDANWDEVDEANGYTLDVAMESSFNTFVPGYKNLYVGDTTSFNIFSEKLAFLPEANKAKIIAPKGFAFDWDYNNTDKIGYVIDVALDSNFSSKLYNYDTRFTVVPYKVVGNLKYGLSQVYSDDEDTSDTTLHPGQGVVLTGLLSNNSYPKLYYFLEESTIRLYKNDNYTLPAIAEDIDTNEWLHIAIVNTVKYTYLYVNGKLEDKVRNVGFSTDFDIGYSIGHFYGYITGLRITKGVARYITEFLPPLLPYSKD